MLEGARRKTASLLIRPLIAYDGVIMTKHFLLFSDYASDVLERRQQFRGAHLDHAWAAVERGDIVVAGALADPVDGAVLMFAGDSPAVAEDFARADPYVTGGLVTRWRVREWTTVVGTLAATPVRPEDAR